jgi:hypothetical protein
MMLKPYQVKMSFSRGKECLLCGKEITRGKECINLVISFNAILGIKVTKDEEIHPDCSRMFVVDIIEILNKS